MRHADERFGNSRAISARLDTGRTGHAIGGNPVYHHYAVHHYTVHHYAVHAAKQHIVHRPETGAESLFRTVQAHQVG